MWRLGKENSQGLQESSSRKPSLMPQVGWGVPPLCAKAPKAELGTSPFHIEIASFLCSYSPAPSPMTAESSLSQACGKCLSAGPAQGSAKVEKTVRIDFISLGGSTVFAF